MIFDQINKSLFELRLETFILMLNDPRSFAMLLTVSSSNRKAWKL